ncbi:MAG: chromate transporter [Bacteroidaceae bacterium]|nr:chromate transporter [Bacteroidaceae bacterium]
MLFNLFIVFFKIGLFTIGGGYAMIPLIEKDVVERNRWVTKEEFLDLLAVAQSAPGVFAVNISIFIGYKLRSVKGAVVAAVGNVLPSIIIILAIAVFFNSFSDNDIVNNVFKGLRPAVVALIAAPVFSVAKSARIGWTNVWIPILSAILIVTFGVSPVYIIMIAAVAGVLWGELKGGKQ